MGLRRFVSALALVLAAFAAWATPQRHNGTELWLNPSESGWGLYLAHQGDTLFATLFVYGPDNQPRWYSASSLTGDGTYTGPLYESSGTPFGIPFDQSTVTRRQVGSMTVTLRADSATVVYDVDGLRVTKQVVPFAFKATLLNGQYAGFLTQPPAGPGGAVSEAIAITVNHSGSSFSMSSQGSGSGACNYSGTSTQVGSTINVSGSYSCSDGRPGPFAISEADLTTDGFTGRFTGNRIVDSENGRIGVLRLGPGNWGWSGWMSDLWLTPGESGWGLNMVGQGEDNIFGTLFHYDAGRRAKWYSIPGMVYIGRSPEADSRGTYQGLIYESTGPWFGQAAFDPGVVTRTNVGSIAIRFLDNRNAIADITINGVTVQRSMVPFAMRANNLSGTYDGFIVDTPAGASTGTGRATTFNVSDNGSSAVTIQTTGGAVGSCTYSGARSQYGQRVGVTGTYTCADGRGGNFALSDIEVSSFGFTAALGSAPGAANLTGHMGGARTTNP